MTNQKKLLGHINEALHALARQPSFQGTQNVVNAVIALLGVSVEQDGWKLFSDSAGKIRSNAHWFMQADGYADRRAVYEIAKGNDRQIDFKTYWVQNTNKSVIHWVTAITPNFEDAPWLASENVGIDFVVPEKADRVFVVLSKEHALRVIELCDRLSPTAAEIFSKWTQPFDFSNKGQLHQSLWDSFNFEAINKLFYKTISSFFTELKQHLRSKATELFDDHAAALFVNRLIGRIIFCWFLDRKGILNSEIGYFSMDGADANEHYHKKLETLFFRVLNTPLDERPIGIDPKTPFLNGGLFEAKAGDHEGDVRVSFPADYFDRLYEFLRRYNFTTDESSSAFQQVAIDPEMLGRIFENLLAEQVEETGEQARKAKGAFYTPREIVDYMCKESLREYLKTRIPESADRDEQLSKLLDKKPHEFRDQQRNYRGDLKPYKHEILGALDDLTVLDPACGSGAFPMGMLHLLLETYDRLEGDYDPYKKKMSIIHNNIFGVDIEPMAVEIARLRAWLSIIVDEDASDGRIEPLPNLDFKFVCANTLNPLDHSEGLYDTLKESQLIEIRDEYFRARKYSRKQELREKFTALIKGKRNMDGMFASDRERQLKTYQPFNAECTASFFDNRVMFGIENGFSMVIGNPPYGVSITGESRSALVGYLGSVPDFEIYYYFIELAKKVLADNGINSYIIPNTFLFNVYASDYRKKLLSEWEIKNIIDCTSFKLFESATVHNAITIFLKSNLADRPVGYKNTAEAQSFEQLSKRPTTLISQEDLLLSQANWGLAFKLSNEVMGVIKKMRSFGKVLSDYFHEISQGLIAYDKHTGQSAEIIKQRAYHYTHKTKDSLSEWLWGEDVTPFKVKWNEKEWIDYCQGIANPRSPKFFQGRRILVREITNPKIYAGLAAKEQYHDPSIIVILDNGRHLLLLLGILNSDLATFYHFNASPKATKGAFPKILVKDLRQFPLPDLDDPRNSDVIDRIEKNVELILSELKKGAQIPIDLLGMINDDVRTLYQLNPDERAVIDRT